MSNKDDSVTVDGAKRSNKLRWLVRGAIAAIVLLILLVVTAGLVAKSYVSPDFIVAQIEADNNCRVEIAETSVSLFKIPARVEIRGLKVHQRDEHADAGTKLADRPPIEGAGIINADSIVLEANIIDLIRKKISVKHLTVDNLFVSEFLIEREGGYSIDPLFDPPSTVNGDPNPEFEEKKKRRDLAKARKKLPKAEREKLEDEPFAISELPLPATMNALNIRGSAINAKIRRNKTRITFRDFQMKVSDIDLDAGDLANHNGAKITITGHLDIEDRDRTVKYADLDIVAAGDVVPFDPITGYINPDLTYQVTVLKGSKLDAIPSLVKLSTKIKKLQEIGLKLDALAEDVTIDRDTTVTMGYYNDRLHLIEPVTIGFNGHDLVVAADSWLHTGSNQHEANAEVFLSKPASEKALGEARSFLAEKAKELNIDDEIVLRFTDALLGPVTKDGQIWIPFITTGDLNDPDVKPGVDLKNLTETLKDEAKATALDALNDLLEKKLNDPTGDKENNP